ncbi:MAG: undecaprenyl-diphosphate phosphatase, partial [Thermomicrobiales bacterium]
ALHLGTLVAVFSFFRKDIARMIGAIPTALKHPLWTLNASGEDSGELDVDRHAIWGKLGLLIVIASVPAGIVGLLGENAIDEYFHDVANIDSAIATVATLLIIFGLILWWADRIGKKNRIIAGMVWTDAVVIGIAQCLALLPGVSRSGITMSAGLFRNINRADAARFSFLMGIPLITVAGLNGVIDIARDSPSSTQIAEMAAGMISAAVSGFVAIWGLLRFLQRSSTTVFVVYRIAAGVSVLILLSSRFR